MGEFSNVIEKAKVSVTTLSGVVRATVAILVFEKKRFIDYLTFILCANTNWHICPSVLLIKHVFSLSIFPKDVCLDSF